MTPEVPPEELAAPSWPDEPSAAPVPLRRAARRRLSFDPTAPQIMHFESSPLPPMESERRDPVFTPGQASGQATSEFDEDLSAPKKRQQRKTRARSTQQAAELSTLNDILSSLAEFVNKQPKAARHRLQQPFNGRAPRTQQRFLSLYKYICDCAAEALNPASPDQLQEAALSGGPRESLADFATRRIDDLVRLYAAADNIQLKRVILAIACVPRSDGTGWAHTKAEMIQKFSTTAGQVAEARRIRRINGLGKYFTSQTIVRDRMDLDKVQDFVCWGFESCQFSLLPYGVMNLKMESGDKLTLGKVVQSGISGHIIDAYLQSKANTDYQPLSKRTLYRILNVMLKLKPTRALSGLDFYNVQGQEAVNDLENLVKEHVKNKDDKTTLSTALRRIRKFAIFPTGPNLKMFSNPMYSTCIYLSTEYASKVSTKSNCATHCPFYALSHPTKSALSQTCSHEHSDCCHDCSLIKSTCSKLLSSLEGLVDEKVREKATWKFNEAQKDLVEWQRHLLRCSQQRKARLDVTKNLKPGQGLLIYDWGNKLLPRKFLESVREYFGKKGMSILTFALILPSASSAEEMMRYTYTVFLQDCDQTVADVIGLYDYVLARLRKDHPDLKTLFEKTDNASNFKNADLISCRPVIAKKHGFEVDSVVFCEPGDGKDFPDAHFGQLRQLLDARLHAGVSQMTAEEVYDCLKSSPVHIKGANFAVASVQHSKHRSSASAPGIKSYHVFKYEENGRIRGWHHFGVGSGEVLNLKVPDSASAQKLPMVTVKSGFGFVDGIAPSVSKQRVKTNLAAEFESVKSAATKLRSCDVVKTIFIDHVMSSVHRDERDSGPPAPETASSHRCETAMGWAKQPKVARGHFTPGQLALMNTVFESNKDDSSVGLTADDVVELAQRDLPSNEWLRSKQIRSFWTRKKSAAAKRPKQTTQQDSTESAEPVEFAVPDPDEDAHDDYVDGQTLIIEQLVAALPPESNSLFAGAPGDYVIFEENGQLRAGRIAEAQDDSVSVDLYVRLDHQDKFCLRQRMDEHTAHVKHDAVRELLTAVEENDAEATATFDLPAHWLPEFTEDGEATADTPIIDRDVAESAVAAVAAPAVAAVATDGISPKKKLKLSAKAVPGERSSTHRRTNTSRLPQTGEKRERCSPRLKRLEKRGDFRSVGEALVRPRFAGYPSDQQNTIPGLNLLGFLNHEIGNRTKCKFACYANAAYQCFISLGQQFDDTLAETLRQCDDVVSGTLLDLRVLDQNLPAPMFEILDDCRKLVDQLHVRRNYTLHNTIELGDYRVPYAENRSRDAVPFIKSVLDLAHANTRQHFQFRRHQKLTCRTCGNSRVRTDDDPATLETVAYLTFQADAITSLEADSASELSDVHCPHCEARTQTELKEQYSFQDEQGLHTDGLILQLPWFAMGSRLDAGEVLQRQLDWADFDADNVVLPGPVPVSWRVTGVIKYMPNGPQGAKEGNAHYVTYRRLGVEFGEKAFVKVDDDYVDRNITSFHEFTSINQSYVMFLERN